MRLTIPAPPDIDPAAVDYAVQVMKSSTVYREIQERASRIHALNVVLARSWWREGWHGGFW